MCFLLHVVDENTSLFEFWVAVLCCLTEDSLGAFAEAAAEGRCNSSMCCDATVHGLGLGLGL